MRLTTEMSATVDAVHALPSRICTPWLLPLVGVAAAVAIAWAMHGATLFAPLADWSGYRKDFTAFYAASAMISSGSGDAIYHTSAIASYETQFAGHPVGDYGYMAYLNPPAFAAALTPLTLLSFERAYQVWTAFSIALLAIDVWMLSRLAASLPVKTRVLLSVAFLTFLPVVDGLLLGQFSLILLTAWMASYLLLRAGHEAWAGAALTPLLVKPEMLLVLFLLLLVKRRWRIFAGFVPLALTAALLSIAVVGLSEALRYPGYVLGSTTWQANATKSNAMFNWNGIVAMFWGQPSSVPVATLVVILLSLSSLVAAFYFWRGKFEPRSRRFAAQWMTLTIVTVLVDPQMHLQDTVLLALPAVALYAAAARKDRALLAWVFGAAWAIIALGPIPNERLHIDLFALYIAAVGAAIVWRRVSTHDRRHPALLTVATP